MRVVCCVALLALPLVSAGSPDDPEIVDERGDHTGGVQQDPFNGYDIRYAFFADDDADCGGDHMRIQLGLANIFADGAQSPGAAFSASVYFSVNGNDYRTYFRPAGNTNTGGPAAPWIYMYDITNAPSTRIIVPGGVDNSSGSEFYYWCVPHEVLAGGRGDVVEKVWARTYLDNYGVTDLAPDGAPDEVGREYVIGGAVPVVAPGTFNVTVENATAALAARAANFTIQAFHNGTANQTIAWHVQNITTGFEANVSPPNATVAPGATATFHVTVLRTVNATDDAVQAENGTAMVLLGYTSNGGNGTVLLTVETVVDTSDDVDPTSDPSLDGDGGGKESPLPLLLGVAALAVAARQRRRRR